RIRYPIPQLNTESQITENAVLGKTILSIKIGRSDVVDENPAFSVGKDSSPACVKPYEIVLNNVIRTIKTRNTRTLKANAVLVVARDQVVRDHIVMSRLQIHADRVSECCDPIRGRTYVITLYGIAIACDLQPK